MAVGRRSTAPGDATFSLVRPVNDPILATSAPGACVVRGSDAALSAPRGPRQRHGPRARRCRNERRSWPRLRCVATGTLLTRHTSRARASHAPKLALARRRRRRLRGLVGSVHFRRALAAQRVTRGLRAASGTVFRRCYHQPIAPEVLVPSRAVFGGIVAVQLGLALLVTLGRYARPALLVSAVLGIYLLTCDRISYHNNRYALFLFSLLIAFARAIRTSFWRPLVRKSGTQPPLGREARTGPFRRRASRKFSSPSSISRRGVLSCSTPIGVGVTSLAIAAALVLASDCQGVPPS